MGRSPDGHPRARLPVTLELCATVTEAACVTVTVVARVTVTAEGRVTVTEEAEGRAAYVTVT